MSLATQIAALATRVAAEFKTVRSEIAANATPGFGAVDGGNASTYYGWNDIGLDGGNAYTQSADGIYIDGGAA